ncbi:MAG: 1-acyl-sn-glycerol-3-phosphate acyltransferase, partial [Longispora sp.]|nr:1-acyl-sn-glycerol-3-phosphate acyltransferase [Longispora sp. (in: high G+C Gram-positive bacteria)]
MADPIGGFLNHGFAHMVHNRLRGVWVHGAPPEGSFIWAANHHSWWDPFVAAVLLSAAERPASLLMAQENLEKHKYLRRLG